MKNVSESRLSKIEEKIDNMEKMLSQLISTVSKIHVEQQEMKIQIQAMDIKIQNMESKMQDMENNSVVHHQQIMHQLKQMKIDQDFIWEKAVKNERDLAILKGTN